MEPLDESLEYAGSEILLQTIEASIVDEDASGDAIPPGGFMNTGIVDQAKKFIRESKTKALSKMKDEVFSLASAYGLALREMPDRPDEVELELSLSVSTKGEVCIVGAEGTAMMKVTMKWKKA